MNSFDFTGKIKKAYQNIFKQEEKNWFLEDLQTFIHKSQIMDKERFDVNQIQHWPFLHDKTATTHFDTHYVYHPAWAARVVRQISPKSHTDISSTLHFCSILSAFVPTNFYDYRPASLKLSQLTSKSADLTRLPFLTSELESLSCMHTIEHIGLGRYGDQIDPIGDVKAMSELQRVVKPGGSLLLVTPVGQPVIAFNAHRIYSFELIVENFPDMELIEFSLIPDNAIDIGIINNCPIELVKDQKYGCGCFWFKKKIK